jgi:hypothetical protein
MQSDTLTAPIKLGSINPAHALIINAPAIFAREDFMQWLNDQQAPTFTWHKVGQAKATEYSDVVVLVDSNYEGSDSEMPRDIWETICDAVYDEFGGHKLPGLTSHVHVRLTNLAI